MDRTVADSSLVQENFAGLFKRLSRANLGHEPEFNTDVPIESSIPAESATFRSQRAVPQTNAGNSLANTSSKSGSKKPESQELSYEKALRIHKRHTLSAEIALPAVARSTQKTGKPQSTGDVPAPPAADVAKLSIKVQAPVTQSAKQPASSHGKRATVSSASLLSKQAEIRKASSSTSGRRAKKKSEAQGKQSSEHHKKITDTQLELRPQSLALEQRKTILSVRLNEEEAELLRLRAEESGISVSAYMRSCVLDADHLRAQVKQALAEMRAYAQPSEPAHLSAPESGSGGREAWSRILYKTFSFLFGARIPYRNQA